MQYVATPVDVVTHATMWQCLHASSTPPRLACACSAVAQMHSVRRQGGQGRRWPGHSGRVVEWSRAAVAVCGLCVCDQPGPQNLGRSVGRSGGRAVGRPVGGFMRVWRRPASAAPPIARMIARRPLLPARYCPLAVAGIAGAACPGAPPPLHVPRRPGGSQAVSEAAPPLQAGGYAM